MDEYAVKKYQIHCPECGHEFVWNLDVIEREHERLRKRHTQITQMITGMKARNNLDALGRSDEYRRLKAESATIIARLTALKTVKENNHRITDEIYNRTFKDVVRERYGDEAYYKLLDAVKERLKPIRIEKLMVERVKK